MSSSPGTTGGLATTSRPAACCSPRSAGAGWSVGGGCAGGGWLQDALAGYGYAPGRALVLLAGAFVAGWLVFRARQPVPVGPGPHPAFNAALYTLEVLIPAPALGQASDFDPQGATLAVAAGLHILGWLLAITVIAAISRSFSRT